jgi:hypothetical protein
MHVVKRKKDKQGEMLGNIIELSSVSRMIQLVPNVDSDELEDLTVENSLFMAESFYINSFTDKEIYQSVY